ncbi:MAG TPA: CRTAC1 family protein [Terriglobia bacterium]|nr:CRTAC1 family protein [Terriglobia bacterium]
MRRVVHGLGFTLIVFLLWKQGSVGAETGFSTFHDIARDIGITVMNIHGGADKDYIIEANGNGAAFFDYNNDGNLDVLIVNGSTLDRYKDGGDPLVALYRSDGEQFTDVTANAGLRTKGWGMGVCVADYDNDGNPDFYITAFGRDALFHNNGAGTFTDVTATARVSDTRWSTGCAFGDYDRDGDVDLYVANYLAFSENTIRPRGRNNLCRYMGADVFCGPIGLTGEPDILYRNNGNGTFTDVTSAAGIRDPNYYGFGVLFNDFDNDGWPDIYVANDSQPNLLFQNKRNGTFEEVGLLSGSALSESGRAQSGMGVTAGDYDGNGYLDIFVTNFAGDTNTLYRNVGNMLFVDSTVAAGLGEIALPHLGWGTSLSDLNNDGWLDLFVANGHVYPQVEGLNIGQRYLQRKELYRNLGNGKFLEIARDVFPDLLGAKGARGSAVGDFDNDGDLDILAVNINDRPSLYRNEGGNRNHWISFRLEGTRSNRSAIGARVEIEAGGRKQISEVRSGGNYISHDDMRIHFGLGETARVDRVRVRWPNGSTEELSGFDADRFIVVREKGK